MAKYVNLGVNTYKIREIALGFYDVWQCIDLCSLQYLGAWTIQQLINNFNIGV